jgi:preprotein translocase subunit SecY
MQKEGGPEGKEKLNRIQKIMSIIFAFMMSLGYYLLLKNSDALKYTEGFAGFFSAAIIVTLLVTGSQITVWLGEQIDNKGIGNGVSMIIFIGIVAQWSSFYSMFATVNLYAQIYDNKWWYAAYPGIVLFVVFSILLVIFVDGAERMIPVQYAAHGGARHRLASGASHLPVRVMMTGVLPVIFASSICSVPATIAMFIDSESELYAKLSTFNSTSWVYCLILALMIIGFNYFYTSIQYDPLQISNDLRKNGGIINGLRPGQPTVEYLESQFTKVSRLGAIALVFIALSPIVAGNLTGIPFQFGGTSLMILVSVTMEMAKSIESYMVARHHKGFLA